MGMESSVSSSINWLGEVSSSKTTILLPSLGVGTRLKHNGVEQS